MFWHAWATYSVNGVRRLALVLDGRHYDVQRAADVLGKRAPVQSVDQALQGWAESEAAMVQFAQAAANAAKQGKLAALATDGCRLHAPYLPGRIFATASNYYEHAREMGTKLAERSESSPYIFMKAESSVNDPGAPVVMPADTQKLDWEVELAVVIGRTARHLPAEKALDAVAGYTVFNDVSARDLTRRSDYPFSHDWFRGKSFDTFGPMGPWMVPAGCIPDPQKLRLTLDVNGARMQDGATSEMIFSVAEQIAYLSRLLTLKPGDLIATGTPTGVGMGRGIFLKPGDVMKASVEGIGSIENPVVAERQ